jgi:hypothetical protein
MLSDQAAELAELPTSHRRTLWILWISALGMGEIISFARTRGTYRYALEQRMYSRSSCPYPARLSRRFCTLMRPCPICVMVSIEDIGERGEDMHFHHIFQLGLLISESLQ